jgi:hypothetical protein
MFEPRPGPVHGATGLPRSLPCRDRGRNTIGGHLPQGALIVSEGMVNGAGHARALGRNPRPRQHRGRAGGVSPPGVGSCSNRTVPGSAVPAQLNGAVLRCMNQLHLTNVTRYGPAGRYWPFQTYESLAFLGLVLA